MRKHTFLSNEFHESSFQLNTCRVKNVIRKAASLWQNVTYYMFTRWAIIPTLVHTAFDKVPNAIIECTELANVHMKEQWTAATI